ncbi:MAG: hypothetical protein KGY60_01410 [Bacteroidales bacterium]|nr:hypothetical protein [Bacteroidales bacterium]
MIRQYHSNGKLLLTGEYLVLKGAEALALPLKKGQTLRVKPLEDQNRLIWRSIYEGQIFFQAVFSIDDFRILQTNNQERAGFLQKLLQRALSYIPSFIRKTGYFIETFLSFPLEWGLGSSSTLISNLAQWLDINPFELNQDITRGSGYDIACARSNGPILYQYSNIAPQYREIDLSLPFQDYIYFVYTGKKQRSAKEVQRFLTQPESHEHLFSQVDEINEQIINSSQLTDFEQALRDHEAILSRVLDAPTIQQKYFKDFPGTIKSLGAWGGDFILVTWTETRSQLKDYFNAHDMDVIFSWNELIKDKKHAG